jgi:hypothetical protein
MEPWVMESTHSMTMSLVSLNQRLISYIWDIDLGTYEHMLEYYHGMCKDLCVKWENKNRMY